MTRPIILTSGDIRTFGERTAPLPRTKAYAFSLDLAFSGVTVDGEAQRVAMRADASQDPSDTFRNGLIYHVQDEVLIRSADGKVRDIPHEATIASATALVVGSPTGGADLKARVLARWQQEAYLSFDIRGVLYPGGALLRFWSQRSPRSLTDTIGTQIAISTECQSANFRWLVQGQLFGWGRVELVRVGDQWTARFTYDLYSMTG
jgi:hypothetical protein